MAETKVVLRPIAHLYNDFPEKFGLPRQSGLADDLLSVIVMEKEFRVPEAFRALEQYERLWLLWQFDGPQGPFSPTVRPPRLGGNERVGVFATRSPNRPNHIGLTCVRLIRIDWQCEDAPRLVVGGADIRNGTAIWDIKPYLPYADSYPDSSAGFAAESPQPLKVRYEVPLPADLTRQQQKALDEVLSQDPRPAYQHGGQRVYHMTFAAYRVSFSITGEEVIVSSITPVS